MSKFDDTRLKNTRDITAPGQDLVPITPDDDNDLTDIARSLRCTATGTVAVTTAAGTSRTWTLYSQGEVITCAVKRVLATGTTASVEAYI